MLNKSESVAPKSKWSDMTMGTFFREWIYLLWDGIANFDHDDNKLERLKGKEPKWYDRFTNKRWMFFKTVLAFVGLTIYSTQYSLMGTVK